MKKLLLTLFIALSIPASSQEVSRLGFGAVGGYKSQSGDAGFFVEYRVKNVVSLYTGINSEKLNGFGYFVGIEYTPRKWTWNPSVSVNYNYQNGSEFYIVETDLEGNTYRIDPNNKMVFTIGLHSLLAPDDGSTRMLLGISPHISYRYWSPQVSVNHVDGVINTDLEDRIERRVGNGFGFGLRATLFFGKKKA